MPTPPRLVRPVAEVLKEHGTFNPGWKILRETLRDGREVVTGIENPKFGMVRLVVVCDGNGKPIFDQYQLEEGPAGKDGKRPLTSGGIILPYFRVGETLHVGLIERFREIVYDPVTGLQGVPSLELPRGFSKLSDSSDEAYMRRELGEETGKVALSMRWIGRVNPNTAFYATGVPVLAVEVDPVIRSNLRPDANELILKCDFPPYKDVQRDKIFCGFTLSAFALFDYSQAK